MYDTGELHDYPGMMVPMVNMPIRAVSRRKSPLLGYDTAEKLRQAFPEDLLKTHGQKLIEELGKVLDDADWKLLKDLSVGVERIMFSDGRVKDSIRTITLSTALSLDNTSVKKLLATASSVREQLDDEKLEELTEKFFEAQPDLAITLEQSPVLYALSKADRRLVVWFVGIIVTLWVGNALLNIGTDNPDLKNIIEAFGLNAGGGVVAGLSAAKLTDKALDRLPQQEAE